MCIIFVREHILLMETYGLSIAYKTISVQNIFPVESIADNVKGDSFICFLYVHLGAEYLKMN